MSQKAVKARINGSTLVVAFHNSRPPLIWTFDLARNHSFSVALQGDEGEWELGVTSPKGEFYSVAHFAAREDADEAFAALQKIMMKGRARWLKKLALGLIFVLVVLYIVGVLTHLQPSPPDASPVANSGPANNGQVEIQNGVPLPADQVLKVPPGEP